MRRSIALLMVLAACAPRAEPEAAPPGTAGSSPSPAAGSPVPSPELPRPGGRRAPVVRVVDGDTIVVLLRGAEERVRLIGIDTPETVHPFEPVECFGHAASEFTRRRLEGRRVRLELDVERRDRYGRLLAYVWLGRRMFNEVLVAAGYAQVATFPPNVRYADLFLAAERLARDRGRGLWSNC